MKLLLVNANTNTFVTETVAQAANRCASPGTEIVAVTSSFGARIIESRAENAIGAYATLALMAEHAPGCDAAIVAVSYDTGLAGARELLSIPVVGMTEAALLTACMLGGRIGVVSFGRRVAPLYRELVGGYGLAGRIAGWRVIESAAPYRPGGRDGIRPEIAAQALDLIERDGAEVIVVTGAVMAGLQSDLQPELPVPVLDGISCAVPQAELLVRLGPKKALTGSYSRPGPRELIDVPAAIAQAFSQS